MTDSADDRSPVAVAALQWGLVAAFVVDTTVRLVRNYYRTQTSSIFGMPDWLLLAQLAALPALALGALGGVWWVGWGPGDGSRTAHDRRRRFVGAFVVAWGLAIVPTAAAQAILGDGLYSVPYFVIPTLSALAAALIATWLGYRADPTWYERRRHRLIGAAQGAFVGLAASLVVFVVYSRYLLATGETFSFDGTPMLVGVVLVGALGGYALTDTPDRGDRAVEFLTLLFASLLGLTVVSALSLTALSTLAAELAAGTWLVGLSWLAALLLATVLSYGYRTHVYARLTGDARPSRHGHETHSHADAGPDAGESK